MTLAERLRIARDWAHMTQAQLARSAGMRQQSIALLEAGKSKRTTRIAELAKALGVRSDWLATGEGLMTLKGYDDLRLALVESGDSGYEETRAQPLPGVKRRIPVKGTASMGMDGFWVDMEYPVGAGDGYFEHPSEDPDAYALRVKGDSMFPAIRSGWFVVVEPSEQPQVGEYVLVRMTDGRSTVKELLWHRNGEYALLAVASGERLTLAENDVIDVHPIAAVLPPSKHRSF